RARRRAVPALPASDPHQLTRPPSGAPRPSSGVETDPPGSVQPAQRGGPHHGGPDRVAGCQVDFGVDAPVVVPGRVRQGLPYLPDRRLLVDPQQLWGPRTGVDADGVVVVPVVAERS